MFANRKRSYSQDVDLQHIADVIWQHLEKLRASNSKDILKNIDDFLIFLDRPGIETLFSEPIFTEYFQQLLIDHSTLLSNMHIGVYPLKPQMILEPIQELKGVYQYVRTLNNGTKNRYLTTDVKNLYFEAASHGSLLAAIRLVNHHIFLLQNQKMEEILSGQDYEILIKNLLKSLGPSTPSYLLASDLYYNLSGFLFQQDEENLDSLYYMKLTLKCLMVAHDMLEHSSTFIQNTYGEEFNSALKNNKVFLSDKSFLSIEDYMNYICRGYVRTTGMRIDLNTLRKEVNTELKAKEKTHSHRSSEHPSILTQDKITEALKKPSISVLLYPPISIIHTPFWIENSKKRRRTEEKSLEQTQLSSYHA